jgi:hypothetical protein
MVMDNMAGGSLACAIQDEELVATKTNGLIIPMVKDLFFQHLGLWCPPFQQGMPSRSEAILLDRAALTRTGDNAALTRTSDASGPPTNADSVADPACSVAGPRAPPSELSVGDGSGSSTNADSVADPTESPTAESPAGPFLLNERVG